MAKIPMHDPLSKEARSSWLAGLTEAANKLSGLLEMKTETLNNLPLPELFISEDDRYRIFQAPLGNKLWLSSPAPVIKKNGVVITPDNDYFTVDCLGGSVVFDENHRLTAGDSLTVDALHIAEGSGKLEDLTNDIDATAAIAEHYRGYFATYAELAAITGVNGDFAIVGGSENIFYVWDNAGTGWVSTFTETDLSNYYTKSEVNDEIDTALSDYYTKAETDDKINTAIADGNYASYVIADSIPTVDEAEENVLYLVRNSETEYFDIYAKIPPQVPKATDNFADVYGLDMGTSTFKKITLNFPGFNTTFNVVIGDTIENAISKINKNPTVSQFGYTASFDELLGQITFSDSSGPVSCTISIGSNVLTPQSSSATIERLDDTTVDLSNYYTKQEVNTELESKQDTLTGTQGQIVGFDASGNAVAQAAPATGVTSFNGRTGAVMPANGDYTAAQVGARASDWTPTAADVGALTQTAADARYLQLSGGQMSGNLRMGGNGIYLTECVSFQSSIDNNQFLGNFIILRNNTYRFLNDSGNNVETLAKIEVDSPLENFHAANKLYVDDAISTAITGAINASY